jgi:hypothetical protein
MHEQMLAKLDLDHKDEKKPYRKMSDMADRHGSAHKVRGEKKEHHREKSTGKPKKKKAAEKK